MTFKRMELVNIKILLLLKVTYLQPLQDNFNQFLINIFIYRVLQYMTKYMQFGIYIYIKNQERIQIKLYDSFKNIFTYLIAKIFFVKFLIFSSYKMHN